MLKFCIYIIKNYVMLNFIQYIVIYKYFVRINYVYINILKYSIMYYKLLVCLIYFMLLIYNYNDTIIIIKVFL